MEKVYVVMTSYGDWEDKSIKISAVFVDLSLALAFVKKENEFYKEAKMSTEYPDTDLLDSDLDEYIRLREIAEGILEYNTSWVEEQDIRHEV